MAAFIVTGGFGILGQAVGRAALAQGRRTILVDIAAAAPADLTAPNCKLCPGVDLLDEAATAALFSKIAAEEGGIAALANVAGGFTWQTVEQADPSVWQRMMDMNLRTAVSASRAALPFLRGVAGSIVNVGAFGALRAGAGMAPYAAAKSAVHRFTEALAEETRSSGLRVNAVLPSIIDTPSNRRDMPDADRAGWVSPDELAQIILFLTSDAARAINGVLLPVTK